MASQPVSSTTRTIHADGSVTVTATTVVVIPPPLPVYYCTDCSSEIGHPGICSSCAHS